MRRHRDERGFIAGWLVKLVVGLAVLGIVLFDAGSIVVNYFTLDSTADEVAVAVSLGVGSGTAQNLNALIPIAEEVAQRHDVKLVAATIDAEGVVHVKLRRKANTILVGRIGPLKDWARATVEGQAGTLP